ncbi:putative Ig domain-containing protein [Geminisphaera colitermitum]|uniref:putative Ig domain-containing protein n=1 Tax=Geminisphaera colitermitum TaxID=1148786 RepID=UPI0002F6BDA6|nr:putative Ig domain-containing protein [Geminisphaera colitermitum]
MEYISVFLRFCLNPRLLLTAFLLSVVSAFTASNLQAATTVTSNVQLVGDQHVDLLPGDPITLNVTYGRTTPGTEWSPPEPRHPVRVTVYLTTDGNPGNQDNFKLTFFDFTGTEEVTRNFEHTRTITVVLPRNFTGNYYLISEAVGPLDTTKLNTISANSARVNIRSVDSPTVGLVTSRLGTTVGTVDEYSENPSISNDGRYVVFHSEAFGLVDDNTITLPTDSSGRRIMQVYLRDLLLNKTILISQRANRAGTQESRNPQISPDGRYVVFQSAATNLVDYDLNNQNDIFVYGVRTGAIKRISIPNKIFPVTSLDSQGNYGSFVPSISDRATDAEGNGYYMVTFESDASNFVRVDDTNVSIKQADTNGVRDIYAVRLSEEMNFEWIAPVSVSEGGVYGSSMSSQASVSADARWIVFRTLGGNLPVSPTSSGVTKTLNTTEIVVKEIHASDGPIGKTQWISLGRDSDTTAGSFFELDRESFNPVISKDGRYVAFGTRARFSASGGNYLRSPSGLPNFLNTAQVWLVNRWFDGENANRDRVNNMTLSLVSQTNGGFFSPDDAIEPIINGNARYVGFRTTASGVSMQPASVTRSDGVVFPLELTDVLDTRTYTKYVQLTLDTPGSGYTGATIPITILKGPTIIVTTTVPVTNGIADFTSANVLPRSQNNVDTGDSSPGVLTVQVGGTGGSGATFNAEVIELESGDYLRSYYPESYVDTNAAADIYIRDTGIVGFTGLTSNTGIVSDQGELDGTLKVTITGGGGTGAKAIAIVQDGRVIRVDLLDSGSGYTHMPSVTIGSGGEATVSALLADGNELVSRNKFGEPTGWVIDDTATAASHNTAISQDGRYVAFTTLANNNGGILFGKSNQWPQDTNGKRDIYLVDRKVGTAVTPEKGAAPTVTITVDTAAAPFGSSKFIEVTAFDGADLNEESGNIVKGNIVSVEIFADGVRLTNITETVGTPYTGLTDDQIQGENPTAKVVSDGSASALWTAPMTAGYSQIYAVVTDNNGNVTISDIKSVQVIVPTSQKPTVTLAASPSVPDESEIGDPIAIKVMATDPEGTSTITRAVIYSNGHRIASWSSSDGATWTGEWSTTYNPSAGGAYALQAIVTDATGNAIVSNKVDIKVKGADVPNVTIITPSHSIDDSRADDPVFVGIPVNFIFTAVAGNPATQSSPSVAAKILRNSTEVAVLVPTPTGVSGTYTTTWPPTAADATAGEVVFRVIATDPNNGNSTTKDLTITVLASAAGLPTITIQDPDGSGDGSAAFLSSDTSVIIRATATAVAPATITNVVFDFDGQILPGATRNGDVWSVELNPSQYSAGTYSLKATAIDSQGARKSDTLSVTISDPLPQIVIKSPATSPYSMNRGETLELLIEASTPSTLLRIVSVTISIGDTTLGNATYVSGKTYRYSAIPSEPGIYTFTATAVDSNGKQAKASIKVQVHEPIVPPIVGTINDIFYKIYGRSPTADKIDALRGQLGDNATEAEIAAALLTAGGYTSSGAWPSIVIPAYLAVMGHYPNYEDYIYGIRLVTGVVSYPSYVGGMLFEPITGEYTTADYATYIKYLLMSSAYAAQYPGSFVPDIGYSDFDTSDPVVLAKNKAIWSTHVTEFALRTYVNVQGSKPKRQSEIDSLVSTWFEPIIGYDSLSGTITQNLHYTKHATAVQEWLTNSKDIQSELFYRAQVATTILALTGEQPTIAEVNKYVTVAKDSKRGLVTVANYYAEDASNRPASESKLKIVTQPKSQTVQTGASEQFTLTVAVSGAGVIEPIYQWYKGDNALVDVSGRIQGSNTSTLTISNVTGSDAAKYKVVVRNTQNAVTSKVATIQVAPPAPQLAVASLTLDLGESVLFTIANSSAMAGDITYYAKGLPKGLKIDKNTGQVYGTVTAKSNAYKVEYWSKIGKISSNKVEQVIIINPPLPPGMVSGSFSSTLGTGIFTGSIKNTDPAASGLTYEAQKLPKGLKLNKSTGEITGTITAKPGTYTIKVRSKVGSNVSAWYELTFVVEKFPVAGSYVVNFGGAGQLTLTIADNGSYTGKLTYNGTNKTYSMRGYFTLSADQTKATLSTGINNTALSLSVAIPTPSGSGTATATLTDGNGSPVSGTVTTLSLGGGVTYTEDQIVQISSTANASKHYVTIEEVDAPFYFFDNTDMLVEGSATITISKKNVLSFKGTGADGSKITASTTGSGDVGGVRTYLIYTNPYKTPGGYFTGELNLTNGRFDAPFSDILWNKPAKPSDKLYPSGFGPLDVTIQE